MKNKQLNNCITFEDMTDYIFGEINQADFLNSAARINKHISECPQCRKMYDSLMLLEGKLTEPENAEPVLEESTAKIFNILLRAEDVKTNGVVQKMVDALLQESQNFKRWISFNIKSLTELIEPSGYYIHPTLVTVMKSDNGANSAEQTESTIQSSLIDSDKNRVSIGMDGTLSLYFNSNDHAVGKRIIILPDAQENEDDLGAMMKLQTYDESISYVRFEGIAPGQYTVVIEQ